MDDENRNFDDSADYCRDNGGILVQIENELKYDAIISHVRERYSEIEGYGWRTQRYWVGMQYEV